jgi:O-6-methylguanine DNA methyltransferase
MSDLNHPEHVSLVKLSTPAGTITVELQHDLPTDQLEQATLDDFTVTRLWLSDLVEHPEATEPQAPETLKNVLLSYFDGNIAALTQINFDLIGLSDFQFDVLGWLAQAPAEIVNYKDIAKAIGKPKSARAVGTALSSNPIPLIIPCHRVLPVSGKIGGYLGSAKDSSSIKRYLLWHEGLIESTSD